MEEDSENSGIIGKFIEDGKPVIFSFDRNLPEERKRSTLPWLTVISWKYDGSQNNGMPISEEAEKMYSFEDAVESSLLDGKTMYRAYGRTGNDLKEFVYYIQDQAIFLDGLNKTLASHPPYPIEVKFYKDESWEDLKRLIGDFKNG